MKNEKCDYCEEEGKFYQTFSVKEKEGAEQIIWQRVSCEKHKDHSED